MSRQEVHELENRLYRILGSERFRTRTGPGNDLPFYICPYNPAWEEEMRQATGRLLHRLRADGHKILHIDLYTLAIDLIKARDLWETVLEAENEMPRDELLENLAGVLDAETHLAPAIRDRLREQRFDLLLLTGVGTAWPLVRIHSLLTNLEKYVTDLPLVVFFPGDYEQSLEDGARLSLFGILTNDRYYRAWDIRNYSL